MTSAPEKPTDSVVRLAAIRAAEARLGSEELLVSRLLLGPVHEELCAVCIDAMKGWVGCWTQQKVEWLTDQSFAVPGSSPYSVRCGVTVDDPSVIVLVIASTLDHESETIEENMINGRLVSSGIRRISVRVPASCSTIIDVKGLLELIGEYVLAASRLVRTAADIGAEAASNAFVDKCYRLLRAVLPEQLEASCWLFVVNEGAGSFMLDRTIVRHIHSNLPNREFAGLERAVLTVAESKIPFAESNTRAAKQRKAPHRFRLLDSKYASQLPEFLLAYGVATGEDHHSVVYLATRSRIQIAAFIPGSLGDGVANLVQSAAPEFQDLLEKFGDILLTIQAHRVPVVAELDENSGDNGGLWTRAGQFAGGVLRAFMEP